MPDMEQIRKTIQRKRSIRGLHKYEDEIDARWMSGEITTEQFNQLNDVLRDQAALIYERLYRRSQQEVQTPLAKLRAHYGLNLDGPAYGTATYIGSRENKE